MKFLNAHTEDQSGEQSLTVSGGKRENIEGQTSRKASVMRKNLVEQLKNGVSAMRMPSDTLESNWAWLVITAPAWNLKDWLGIMQPNQTFGWPGC